MPSHFDTLQLHAGQPLDGPHRPRAVPIYATTSFAFQDSAHGARLFGLEELGYSYTRIGNPTNDVFEKRIAELEGGIGGLAVSSGQAAQFTALTALAGPGDNIVASSFLYGGTYNQLKVTFKKYGIETRFAKGNDVDDIEKLINDKTKAVYLETIGNPKYNVPDFEAITKVAHAKGVPVVVDNTFGAGGYLVNPIKHGADIVVHSATKWIGGHGTTIAGAIVDSGNFPFADYPEKFPQFSEANEGYHGLVFNTLGKEAFLTYIRVQILRDVGPALNPFASFLLLQGLETLSLRVDRHSYNAAKLAAWLEKSPHVSWVSYLGLPSHEDHETAKKYLNNKENFGGMLSFGVKLPSDEDVSDKVVDHLKIATNLANVGDSKTVVIAPWFTTHQQLADDEKLSAGVTKDLVRVSVGTEFIDDLIEDFEQAFKAVLG